MKTYLVILLLLSGPVTASEKWWDSRWEARIPITVEAAQGVIAKRPVVITWGRVAGKLANDGYRLASLRLVGLGKSVPFQVDHRDRSGLYVSDEFGLNPQDEIVLTAPAKIRSTYYLYLSKAPMPLARFASGVSAIPLRNAQAHYRLSSSGATVDVQGTGLLDLSATLPANYGQAAVVGLTWKGASMTGQGSNWSVVMNAAPFPSSSDDRWSAVKLVVNGPVRKTVSTSCRNSTIKASDGSILLQANVTRYFSVYSGCPLYDVEDVVECTQAKGDWIGTYYDRLIVGHRPQLDDVLIDGSTGTVRRTVLTDRNIPLTPDGRLNGVGSLVETPVVEDSWYAWMNEESDLGLAVFYGAGENISATKPGKMGYNAGWAMWQMDNGITFSYTGLRPSTMLQHRFRAIGVGYEKPGNLAAEYQAWKKPAIRVGSVERRKP